MTKELTPSYTDTQIVRVLYRNWKGEVGWRRIIPIELQWSEDNEFHKGPQWLMWCWDLDKQAGRIFAPKDMITPMIPEPQWLTSEDDYREWGERLQAVGI